MPACMFVRHVHADADRGQGRVLDPLETELQMAGSCFVVGNQTQPLQSILGAPHSRTISPAPSAGSCLSLTSSLYDMIAQCVWGV